MLEHLKLANKHSGHNYSRIVTSLHDLFGRAVKVASIEHLLFMKRIANRPKDRVDIEALEKIQRGEDPYV